MLTRRDFLKMGAALGGGAVLPLGLAGEAQASVQVQQTPLAGKLIPKFVTPLPYFAGARVQMPAGNPSKLKISMETATSQVLPAGFPATNVWAYEIRDTLTDALLGQKHYPAFTIEARRGTPAEVTYVNNLTPDLYQYLTVDQTLHWADPDGLGHMSGMSCPYPIPGPVPTTGHCSPYTGAVPAVVHLHGGEVPSDSDGGPDQWFTPGATKRGPAYNPSPFTYPNAQEAATLWFHDHCLGATRLNVYAGLAGYYLLRDDWDTGLVNTGAAPPENPSNFPAGTYEVEFAIQDRMFDTLGQWYFPDIGINPDHPYWVPEFLGDCILVNGVTWPFFETEPRRYRFRVLNGSNARTYELNLTDAVTRNPGPDFWQIGTDGGLLAAPVKMKKLVLMPGERADIIIDFKGYGAGTNPANGLVYSGTFTMVNTAKSPYPAGAAPLGNSTGVVMQFKVNLPLAAADTTYNPATLASPRRSGVPLVLLTNGKGALAANVTVSKKRQLTLNEVMGMPMAPWVGGPLEVLVNNSKWDGTMSGGIDTTVFPLGITETPLVGSTEIWQIVNLTADAHPMHLHLVQFQIQHRQAFDVNGYNAKYALDFPTGVYQPAYGPPNPYQTANADGALGGNPAVTPFLKGKILVPAANEVGWKDTIMCPPGQVTTIVVRWTPTDVAVTPADPAGTNLYPFDPTAGPGYVWHCHIVDHEDNEMMRPQKVIKPATPV